MQRASVTEPADSQRRISFFDDARDLHASVHHDVRHRKRSDSWCNCTIHRTSALFHVFQSTPLRTVQSPTDLFDSHRPLIRYVSEFSCESNDGEGGGVEGRNLKRQSSLSLELGLLENTRLIGDGNWFPAVERFVSNRWGNSSLVELIIY